MWAIQIEAKIGGVVSLVHVDNDDSEDNITAGVAGVPFTTTKSSSDIKTISLCK